MRAAFVTANRRLDLTPNQGLSLPVRLRSSPRNDIGLVGEGLPRLLVRRGEAIWQGTEIVNHRPSLPDRILLVARTSPFWAWSCTACAAAINRK